MDNVCCENPKSGLAANIERVANGFIVRIGFNIFVSKEWTEVSQRLKEYFDHPIEAEKKYS